MRTSHILRIAGSLGLGLAVLASTNSMAESKPWPDYKLDSRQTAIAACTLLTDIEQVGDELVAVGDRGIIVKASIADIEASIADFNGNQPPTCGFKDDLDTEVNAEGEEVLANAEVPAAFDPNCICHTVHSWEPGEDDPGYYRYNQPEWRVWQQANVPSRSLITAVTFADENNGWAVGHDALILRTRDGGDNWEIQRVNPDGLVLPSEHEDPEALPFPLALLDVKFFNVNRGIAIGAFGLLLSTTDGGANWTQIYLGEDGDFEFHLNNIVELGDGSHVIIAEMGQILHSVDAGRSWTITETGYEGSFFGGIPMGTSGLVTYGLRGNAYATNDVHDPESWQAISTGTDKTMLGGISTGNNEGLVVGDKGEVLYITNAGASITKAENAEEDPLATAIAVDGGFVAVGAKGVQFLPPVK